MNYQSKHYIGTSETTNLGLYILDKIDIKSLIGSEMSISRLMEDLENLDWETLQPEDCEYLEFLFDGLFRVKKGKQLQYTKPRGSTLADSHRRREQGRNEPCNCGSGKKFKKCCGKVINED